MKLGMPGAVYVAALNFTETLEALGDALHRDPYMEPPRAPVLHIKPANTWSENGAPIVCPSGVAQLRMGGTLGVVIDRTARHVEATAALDYVRGYTLANDVSVPYESHFRPAIRQRCRDGFCPMGPTVVAKNVLPAINQLVVRIDVNGGERCVASFSNLVRGVEQLIADVTEFMTLNAGDLLLLGEPHDAPLAGPGDRVRVAVRGVGVLENPIVAESELTA